LDQSIIFFPDSAPMHVKMFLIRVSPNAKYLKLARADWMLALAEATG